MRPLSKLRPGYSLLEVMVVIGMALIVLALIVPAVVRGREASNSVICQDHLKNLAMAALLHHNERGVLPPYSTGRPGELYGSWFTHLLPYLNEQSLYNLIREGDVAPGGKSIFEPGAMLQDPNNQAFDVLKCQSDPTAAAMPEFGKTNYLGNWFSLSDTTRGIYSGPRRLKDLCDGPATVVLFAEAYAVCDKLARLALVSSQFHNFGITQDNKPSDDPSYAPDDFTMFQTMPSAGPGPDGCHKWRTQTPHAVMHVAMGDGSVRRVNPSISPENWKHGLKPSDGQPLPTDE